MAEGGDNEPDYREPAVEYRDDPSDPDNYLLLMLDIIGLKKALLSSKAKNLASEPQIDIKPFSLDIQVQLKAADKKSRPITYGFAVKKFPAEVVPPEEGKKYTVKRDNEIQLRLRKKVAGRWAHYLEELGLDVADQ